MPSLAQTLPTNDIGFLRIIASLWGLELTSADPAEAVVELSEGLCDAELLEEIVSTLPKEGRAALSALVLENGRMPWVVFARRFGELREMGAARRDREHPHTHPNSATEILWYRALLAKAFFNGEKGPQEFAFIPDDLFMAMDFGGMLTELVGDNPPSVLHEDSSFFETKQPASEAETKPLGRPASPAEKSIPILANDRILDDACTYLAALRSGIEPPEMRIPTPVLKDILLTAGVISSSAPNPEAMKAFLEAPRLKALEILRGSWQTSETFDELRQLPGLVFEGGWNNQPLVTREFLLNLLDAIPEEQWWSLTAFMRDIKTRYPDYQRPSGDYDSWFIKRAADGVFLRGFSSWEDVDGALVRYFICGPLHWLGFLDLAVADEGAAATSFRAHKETGEAIEETGKLSITSQGKIIVPRLAPRSVRYQVARFCEWVAQNEQEYQYHVTARSLKQAKNQNLRAEHLLSILRKNTAAPISPTFVKALQRWDQNGSEARIENLVVLKVTRPETLNELRTSKASRFLGEILGPTTIVIQPGAEAKVMAALVEMGILSEGQIIT